jgi:tetratricopeptide (TPR) repeat protein
MGAFMLTTIYWALIAAALCVCSALLLWPQSTKAADSTLRVGDFKVKETGNKIEITSPWGQKSYETEFLLGAMKHYRIEIPIEDLRPPMTPMDTPPGGGRDLASVAPVQSTEAQKSIELKITGNEARKDGPNGLVTDTPSTYDSTDRLILEANRLYNLKRFYEASVYVEELIRKNPSLVRAWVMKGSLLHVQGYGDLAKKAWAKAAELDPQDPQVKDILKRYP